MATLTSTKIKNTYDALLKSIDNDAIGTTAKQITDGLGNVTPLYVSTTQVGIGVTPESGLNLHVFGDAKIGSNLTVIGNLVVEGSTTTVGTDTLTVKDPLIVLANNNTSTDAVDIGFYGKYTPSGTTLYSGLFREALTGKYRLFKDLQVEPTTTVNTSGTGYAVASLIANLEGNVTGNLIGSVTGGTFSGTLLSNVVATTQSAGDNSTKVATTAYVDNQVGLYDTLSEVLANGNTTGGTDIAVSSGDDITFVDDSKAIFGTDGDLEIYHNSATDQSFISINGELDIRANTLSLKSYVGETMLRASSNGTVRLYYDGVEKLQTTSTGISVTGDVDFTGNINIGDNQKILFGDGGDIEMFFNGSTFVIDDTVEVFGFDIDTNLIRFRGTDLYTEISNAQHTFWTNGTQRLQINSSGVNVSSDFTVNTDTLFVDYSADSVGIGLTNPSDYSADELVISVPDDSGMTLVSGTTDTAYIRFADGTSAADQANFISHDHNTNTLTIFSQAKVSIGILEAEVAYFTDTNFYVDKSTTIDDNLFVDGNVGIGVSTVNNPFTAQAALQVGDTSTTTNNGLITIGSGTAGSGDIYFADGTLGGSQYKGFVSYKHNGDYLAFGTAETTRMIIDSSGNVGINNTNPSAFNSLGGGGVVIGDGTQTNNLTLYSATTGGGVGYGHIAFADSNSSGSTAQYAGLIQYYHGTDEMSLYTNSSPRLTIDSSGNVGIGIADPLSKLHISGQSGTTGLPSLLLYGESPATGQRYGFNVSADQLDISALGTNAGIGFYTGGNASSITEKMRIDSSGNVGIGGTPSTFANYTSVTIKGGSSGSNLDFKNSSGTRVAAIVSNPSSDFGIETNEATPILFKTNGAERMRIDSSGKVGVANTNPSAFNSLGATAQIVIGDSSSVSNLTMYSSSAGYGSLSFADSNSSSSSSQYSGLIQYYHVSNSMQFYTSATERMRITSGGAVYIGRTGPDISTETGFRFDSNGEAYASLDTSGTNAWHVYDMVNNAYRFFVSSAGQIYATATSISAISDITLKENIKPLETGLNEVMKLQPRRFDWKNGDGKNIAGFVAQEVEEILPDLVSDYKYTDEETKKSLKMGDMIPTLVKAIQELKAEVELLKTQINN